MKYVMYFYNFTYFSFHFYAFPCKDEISTAIRTMYCIG